MFDKILIATDNSPLMRNAIQYTANIFPYSEYHLINVINTSDGSIPQTHLVQTHMEKISKGALKKGRDILNDLGINEAKLAMPMGTPSKQIMRYISKHEIDLTVMATHSKSGTQKVHIGDTALHSLQVTHTPSLVFSCSCKPIIPKMIFNPSTFSTYSIYATMMALDLAEYFDASLTVYNIGKNGTNASTRRVKKKAEAKNVEYKVVSAYGASDETILKKTKGYDLMVGSRGRGGITYKLRHLFPALALSNLEKELIAESPIPFLMVGD